MPRDPATASKRLGQTLQESKKLFNHLSAQSRAASASNSSTLFGMLGGFVGAGAAYTIPFYTTATFLGLAPILTGLGIVLGVIAFRGPSRFKLESKLEMHQRSIEVVLEEIRRLPKNAPQDVRDEAWNTYKHLLSISPVAQKYAVPQAPSSPAQPQISNSPAAPSPAQPQAPDPLDD
ncbi:hypothetical protein [Rugamonas rubra]|uniref:hypothetical protein n=1 Tax=Rugamonas rubra TaxID=758825 RepID=UPI001113D951|nr:hypothetical protein [Rugamonas rubra]